MMCVRSVIGDACQMFLARATKRSAQIAPSGHTARTSKQIHESMKYVEPRNHLQRLLKQILCQYITEKHHVVFA